MSTSRLHPPSLAAKCCQSKLCQYLPRSIPSFCLPHTLGASPLSPQEKAYSPLPPLPPPSSPASLDFAGDFGRRQCVVIVQDSELSLRSAEVSWTRSRLIVSISSSVPSFLSAENILAAVQLIPIANIVSGDGREREEKNSI